MSRYEFTIQSASPGQTKDIERFYDQHGYGYKDLAEDLVVTAKSGDQLIGVGRLCNENGVLILRGMQVLEGYQKAGVGRALLNKLDQEIGQRECFTLPWSHLELFYVRISKIFDGDIPVF